MPSIDPFGLEALRLFTSPGIGVRDADRKRPDLWLRCTTDDSGRPPPTNEYIREGSTRSPATLHGRSPRPSGSSCLVLRPWPRGFESAGAKLSTTEPLELALPNRLFYDRRMIRQAVASDAVKAVPLIMQAIGHIALVLTGTTDSHEVACMLSDFIVQKDNRISYQNGLTMEEERELVGVAIFYYGAKARELDLPIERAAARKSGDSNYSIPTEPEASESYLDTISVSPHSQGKGYGSQLIEAGCDRAPSYLPSGRGGPCAGQRLYERVGFCTDYTKRIAGQEYFHIADLSGPAAFTLPNAEARVTMMRCRL
jgi:GNAT superfamily N-acetyltransferase